jgi:hypothetical protein
LSPVTIKGIYSDRLIHPDGTIVSASGWRNNAIVLSCRVLLTAFMKNDATALGIRSLQLGRGDTSWDTAAAPPVADPNTTTKLTDAAPYVIGVSNLKLEYLNAADIVVSTPTNRLQITATLGPGQPTPASSPPYPLREFGLFAQFNGVAQMIDYVRHPLLQKDGALTLERKVRLIF